MAKKWHKGPPPSVGWWPASVNRDERDIRWWDGSVWSIPADPTFTERDAYYFAITPTGAGINLIEWTDRPESWPARSKT